MNRQPGAARPAAEHSAALPPATESRLARTVERETSSHSPQHSGFYLLDDGLSAYVARIALVEEAVTSLDLQYYIYSDDTAGRILTGKLLQAADRGVRVRLLVDDLGTRLTNPWIVTLASHENIHIRVFNPVEGRSGLRRGLEQVVNFGRINHRMHNKLLVADGIAIITGGRNIADGYFSKSDIEFLDVDVVSVGAVVADAASVFDRYWNSTAAVPVTDLPFAEKDEHTLDELRKLVTRYLDGEEKSDFSQALAESTLARRLRNGDVPFAWGKATLYADPPEKATDRDKVPASEYPGYQLEKIVKQARQRLQIANAYLIPGQAGVQLFSEIQRNGAQVDILTNGLGTNDEAVVHGAYAQYRAPLLRAGIRLWELRPMAEQRRRLHWFKGNSRASLHAKIFVLDTDRAFVGSINLDRRSLIQNTEVGLLMNSTPMNEQLHALFERWVTPDSAWRLRFDKEDRIRWHGEDDHGKPLTEDRDPDSTLWQRWLSRVLAWLPIESQI
ncbi:phospholipase D family protein [Microbulbifer hainanensis]|uniref:phospholipase D family protein n=1 Tax=Microbulbifer hainanensis TaxID=2735675 RepID=UPI0018663BD0|nr:phospholipase D family protein [Microbulbifer hainanensis]